MATMFRFIRLPLLGRSLSTTSGRPSTQPSPKPVELIERELYLENQVVRLVLNMERKRNALSTELMAELLNELEGINSIPKVRAVILAGKGPAFSAGHDLKELVGSSIAL